MPPFVAASVPARVIAPVVAVLGVNPVVPALKEDTPEPEAAMVIDPEPLVMVTPDPAVSVALVSVPPVVLPIKSWPSV